MDNAEALVVAMAEHCRDLIVKWKKPAPELPKALQPRHLLWMCDQIEEHAVVGPATKLHRWIGFIQAAMLANRMLDLDGLKRMFDTAKATRTETEDLTDHLDPQNAFEFDIGGQG